MPGGGRRWKTLVSQLRGLRSTSSFPPSPTALGNRQKRDFHIPTPPTMILLFSLPPKPLAHRLWKSPKARFPHSHTADDDSPFLSPAQTARPPPLEIAKSAISTFPHRRR